MQRQAGIHCQRTARIHLPAHPPSYPQAFGDGVTQGLFYREPENQMNVLAEASRNASGKCCGTLLLA